MRKVMFILFCLACLLAPSLSGQVQEKKPIPAKEKKLAAKEDAEWTVDDIVNAEEATGMRISPDCKWVAWIKRAPDKEKNELVGHLMLSSLTETKEVQLTRGSYSVSSPQWSPDGKLLAFLSGRPVPKTPKAKREDDEKDEPKDQVWLINPFGGEPWVLTQSLRDIKQFAWSDSDTILYVAQEKIGRLEAELKEKKDDAQVVDDEPNEPPARLWRKAVKDKEKKAERITANTDRIQALALSSDGRYAVTIHERSLSYAFDNKIRPVVYLYDLDTKQRTQIFNGPKFNISHIAWQRDGKGFYAVNQFTNSPRYLHAYMLELYHYDLATSSAVKVNLGWERGLADDAGIAVTSDGFVTLLADGVRHSLRRYVRNGKQWDAQPMTAKNLQEIRVGKDGKTLVYLESSAISPPRWFRAELDGNAFKKPTVTTDLEADLRKKPLAKTELIRWKGALGEEVEGLLSYPHDYEAGKKYPLIVTIHGGPFWADFDHWDERWAYVRNLLCQRGAFVFRPNYHGSSNYGLAWAESISNGKYYTLPVEDIEKGIDAVVARGHVEPGKIALGGWSNGAILTMALITRRTYAAASAGAGGSEWAADWGVCDFGMSFSNYYLGKSPLEDPELYRKNAPFYDFAKVRTPTLLFHGSDDKDVPTHHSWYEFRALRELGKTDVRFLQFPGEKHGFKKLSHRRRKIEEELAWFDKYLFHATKPINLALKDDSPLAQALALKTAAKQGRRYGVMKNGVLAPETVEYKDLRIGRFEVTRAQFAQFDKKYVIDPGTDNYPASGISFVQAKAYCTWLKDKTGQPFRLGTLKEMEEIYDGIEAPGNTLDFWAGYSINPEDRRKLQEKIRELPGPAPLLKEVGSFKSGDDKIAIFDLGGNVAEWADDAGKGRALGGSADVPAGERHQRLPAPEYVGLRVVCQ
jgi:dipeptidyl aminopeptidase/acylaminoacyl peptidase